MSGCPLQGVHAGVLRSPPRYPAAQVPKSSGGAARDGPEAEARCHRSDAGSADVPCQGLDVS